MQPAPSDQPCARPLPGGIVQAQRAPGAASVPSHSTCAPSLQTPWGPYNVSGGVSATNTVPLHHPASLQTFAQLPAASSALPVMAVGPSHAFAMVPQLQSRPPLLAAAAPKLIAPPPRTMAIPETMPMPPPQPPPPPRAPEVEFVESEVEVVECDEDVPPEQNLAAVPSMRVANSFLDKNCNRTPALTAFGDIIDNCRESDATKLKIEVRTYNKSHLLIFTDNGCGMSEGKVREGLMSIGYTSKDLSTGKHYGFGSKTAIPRIADSCLIFTREATTRYRTVGLLSSVFSDRVGSSETKMPLCSWEAQEQQIAWRVPRRSTTHSSPTTGFASLARGRRLPLSNATELLTSLSAIGNPVARVRVS